MRQISHYLGHESLDTTVIYTHLTALSEARTQAALATLYQPLKPLPLAEVLRRHWLAYERKFGARLLPSHRRAVAAIVSCRTPALGGQLFRCDGLRSANGELSATIQTMSSAKYDITAS